MSMVVYEKAKRQRDHAPAWKKQLTKELLKPKRQDSADEKYVLMVV